MSAYAQLNGYFDFNKKPLAPPVIRIIVHEKPDQRASWDPHGLDGYYLGPALDHYQCYQVHITKTKGTRIVDTVEFFPATLEMPRISSKYLASITALELSNALQKPAPAAQFSQIGTAQLQALRKLSDIFSAALPSRTKQQAPPLPKKLLTIYEHSAARHFQPDANASTTSSTPCTFSFTCSSALAEGYSHPGAISGGDT
jgi:hypothetical protein